MVFGSARLKGTTEVRRLNLSGRIGGRISPNPGPVKGTDSELSQSKPPDSAGTGKTWSQSAGEAPTSEKGTCPGERMLKQE